MGGGGIYLPIMDFILISVSYAYYKYHLNNKKDEHIAIIITLVAISGCCDSTTYVAVGPSVSLGVLGISSPNKGLSNHVHFNDAYTRW